MSLTDPDARNRRVSHFIEPVAWVLALLALALAPIVDLLIDTSEDPNTSAWFLPGMLGYILITVGFGLLLYYTASHRSGLGIVSYCFAYAGGLILILGAFPYKGTIVPQGIIPAAVLYGVSAILLVIYIVHTVAGRETLQNGVETTATVTSAGVNGMVNYVTHWKLTLKFTDQDGKDRWFHIGRTGYGYEVGQQFTIKYNPKKPGSKLGIVVMNNA
ncbi:MAG TPA: DUF3592 domain-containing protein [Galbitalea sp.]|jgi:hypothetical protein|nr:DUF3592 domain-containing protein [Galbitalea sp.]